MVRVTQLHTCASCQSNIHIGEAHRTAERLITHAKDERCISASGKGLLQGAVDPARGETHTAVVRVLNIHNRESCVQGSAGQGECTHNDEISIHRHAVTVVDHQVLELRHTAGELHTRGATAENKA